MEMHAYLIIAHDNFSLLKKLIKLIDDVRNDIYIHIDKRVKNFDFEYFKRLPHHSRVFFTDRVKVKWGDYSQIKTELILLRAASVKEYEYVHLLSGVDLPIKNQSYIHEFFKNNHGCEFVHFGRMHITEKEAERIRYYHFFTGRRNLFNRFITKTETSLGKLLGLKRNKNIIFQRGSNWFSITGNFMKNILENENKIKKLFKHTFLCDEFLVQTILMNSHFINRLYNADFDDSNKQNMRYIDWERGCPYTFTEDDYEEIMNSEMLFVRKLTDENKLPQMIFTKVTE